MRVILLLCVLTSTLWAQFENDPRYVKRRAERYMARLNYEDAISYLSKACERIKDDGEIRILLGECFFARSGWSEAVKAFEAGIKIDKKLGSLVTHFPLALIRSNRLEEAIPYAESMASDGRNERLKANGNFCLGLVAWHKGDIDVAIKYFKKALRHDDSMPKAHYRLGLALLKKKMITQAIAQFKKTLDLDPLHHAAAHNVALAYRRLKDKKNASIWAERYQEIVKYSDEISRIKRALREKPDQIPLIRRLADIYFANGLYESAIEPYSACVAADPGAPEPRYLYAQSLFNSGDYHRARLQVAQVVDRHPKYKKAKILHDRILDIVNDVPKEKK